MKKTIILLLLAFAVRALSLSSNNTSSPNLMIHVNLISMSDGRNGDVFLSVDYNGRSLIQNIKLGLETNLQSFTNNLRLLSVSDAKLHEDDYTMITGKREHCTNVANERTYLFENSNNQKLELTLRVYNDGVAFRYHINASDKAEYLMNERTVYSINENANRWLQSYIVGYEGIYRPSTEEHPLGKWGYPALFEFQDTVYALLTEANLLRGHCGSLLDNTEELNEYQVQLVDKELPVTGEWISPWRVCMIGSLAQIVESTLVTDLSEPCQIEDTDWIKPGVSAWIYWAHNHGSKDFQTVKEYIDLAANMKWPYNLIDWEWDIMDNGGTVSDAIKYSLNKGVKPFLWYNSSTSLAQPDSPGPLFRLNKRTDREKEYMWLNKEGVSGIKIDFFPDDNATSINYYIDLLEDAAKYKLLVNFHGSTIPRGWQRTYPNMMSMEAVYGAEWYNNNDVLTNRAAEHNATLPFTRNVIGPMDYTPGTFSNSQNPHITSYGHELALLVLFESGIQHLPDKPQTYYSFSEGIKEFLSGLPTAWDDTKLLAGYPGKEVVIARKKGKKWYVAGINGTDKERKMFFSLDKLFSLGKNIIIIKDGNNDAEFDIKESTKLENNNIEITCLPRGGFVAIIE